MRLMKIEEKSCIKLGVTILIVYLTIRYWENVEGLSQLFISSVIPLIAGMIIAYIVNILMSFYEHHYLPKYKKAIVQKSRRPVCMLLAFVTLIAVLVLVVGLVIPELLACGQLILAEIPDVMHNIMEWCQDKKFLSEDVLESLSEIDWRKWTSDIIQTVTSGIGSAVDVIISIISSVISGVVTAVVGIVFAIYLLLGKEKLKIQFDSVCNYYLNNKVYTKGKYVLGVLNESFHKYIVGQCTEAVVLGVLCAIGMLILRLPYATMIGTLIGFTALIPVAGAYIGAFVGAFMIFTVSPIKVLIFLIFIVILQQVEGNLIYPKVVGSSLGLPAVWVLAAVAVGGGVLGIPGMMLGVPLTAAIYRLVSEDVNRNKG